MLSGLRDLDLSDTQRDTIRDIAEQNGGAGREGFEQLGQARRALNEAVMSETFNESNVRSLAAALAALEAEAAVQRAYVSSQIWQVLTSAQKVELREIQRQMQEEAQARIGERCGRRRLRR